MSENRIHLLTNPTAANRRARSLRKVIDTADDLGFETEVLTAREPSGIADVIRQAAAEIERLVIVGGDGLVHHALGAVVDLSLTVGLIPNGTGNDFARALDLDGSHHHRHAFVGEPRSLDVIASDDQRWAASIVTAGFSGRVNARANPMRFPPGQAKYTVASFIEAARLEPIPLTIRTETTELSLDSAFFAVANTRYFGGGMAICPEADPTDGLLDITVVGDVAASALLRVLPLVFVGRHVNHPAVTTLRAPWVEIETSEPLWADGEPFGSAPVRLEAKANALRIA